MAAWRDLCDSLNTDPWGRLYRIVMAQLRAKAPPPSLSRDLAEESLRGLFPVPGDEESRRDPFCAVEYPMRLASEDPREWAVDEGELREAVVRLDIHKSPGWGSIPPRVAKGLGNHDTPRLLAAVNSIMERGEFPEQWRTTRVTMIQKPGKDPSRPHAYRPICIVDSGSKIVE